MSKSSAEGFHGVLSGLLLGALVGMLVGLSISSVVGSVVASLLAIVTAFLGLVDRKTISGDKPEGASPVADRLHAFRVGAFSLGCLLLLPIAVFTRTHNLLSPSIQSRIQAWSAAGFSPQESKQILLFQELGSQPKSSEPSSGTTSRRADSVLFAGNSDLCDAFRTDKYQSPRKHLEALDARADDFKNLTAEMRKLDLAAQTRLLKAIEVVVCRE